jgi:hypothetical protein
VLEANMLTRVRGLTTQKYSEDASKRPEINPRGDLAIVQSMPPLSELVRMGNSWVNKNTTGLDTLTALPTTTGQFGIWNGEPQGSRVNYIIDSVGFWTGVVDATQANSHMLFAHLSSGIRAQPTSTSLTPQSLSGRAVYGGRAGFFANASITTNNGWFAVGTSPPVAGAVAGAIWKSLDVPLNGMYVVPPQAHFSIGAVAVAAVTAAVFYFIRWHEVEIDIKS